MNYGQAIGAMKRGECARRASVPNTLVFLEEPGTPQEYFRKAEPAGLSPFVPSHGDQLAEDWQALA